MLDVYKILMKKSKMVNKQQKITLAMYPNTFGVGFVICEGPKEILDYGIKKVQPISHHKYMKNP